MCLTGQLDPIESGEERTSAASVYTAKATDNEPSYSVFTWDHELERWYARDRRATKWQLRCWLRTLYAESWDRVSILIERND